MTSAMALAISVEGFEATTSVHNTHGKNRTSGLFKFYRPNESNKLPECPPPPDAQQPAQTVNMHLQLLGQTLTAYLASVPGPPELELKENTAAPGAELSGNSAAMMRGPGQG